MIKIFVMKAVVLLSKTFFPQHPKAGKPTFFAEKVDNNFRSLPVVISGEVTNNKIHTCRSNYEYWKKKINRLKAEDGVLSVRRWNASPYRSPHETIIDIPAEIVDVQRLVFCNSNIERPFVDRKNVLFGIEAESKRINLETLATNDGLSVEDFIAWFKPAFEKRKNADILDFAIIHFTTFRY
jgi:hypothetical protein